MTNEDIVSNKDIKLKVMEAVQDDVNKGIVRLDSNFMKQLGVNEGDVVKINGEKTTAAIVRRGYPGDINLSIVRIDGDTRKNAKTSIGEFITITKTEVVPAKKVVVGPLGRIPPLTHEFLKQALLNRPIMKNDIISLRSDRHKVIRQSGLIIQVQENFMGFGAVKLFVSETNPAKDIVTITEDTELVFDPRASFREKEEILSLNVNYEDIGGLGEEIKKVREMIELPLKHPEIFERLGIEPPKGVLLHGPPGTGKTLLAKAVASETNSYFILINGPEVMSKFYGESEANLRKKFEEAEQNAPSIIFLDEIDAIATKREETKGDVEKRVVAQLLGLMDGLKSRGKVIVIAATNMPNVVDPALRRPGRFDREIEIGVPDKEGRLEVLKIHTRNMPFNGSLYGDFLMEEIPASIKEKSLNLNVEIKSRQNKIAKNENNIEASKEKFSQLKAELKFLQNEIGDLEKRKEKADQSLIYQIVEKIKGLDGKINFIKEEESKINTSLTALLERNEDLKEEIAKTKSEIEDLENLKAEIGSSKIKLNKLAEELKVIDDATSNLLVTDSRRKIWENKKSVLYQQLEKFNLVESIIIQARKKGVERDLFGIAKVTHGFVGADLNALAKEAAMIVLRRILPDLKKAGIEEGQTIPEDILKKLMVTQKDFTESLKIVRPSAMREVLVETPDVNWEDVGGLEDVKNKLKEAVEWPLKQPEVFQRMGIRPPRGILLYGPPGTGKTLLAKAVAKESEANFILVNGPSLLSKWVGESEKAVREIFRKARQTSPTILFFDEIDALVPRRGRGSGEGSQATEKIVNQVLTEMDGLESLSDVLVIGATNRPDIIDPALLRQGRFDRVIFTPVADEEGRKRIFEIYLKKMPLAEDVDVTKLAKKTSGYVGADIEGVCREAGMLALREDMNCKEVKMDHFIKALEVVKPSVDKEIEDTYKQLEDYFSTARANQIKQEKADYFG